MKIAASDHFKRSFYGPMSESREFQRVEVEIKDIEPNTFRILIRWLYGQSFEEALDAVLSSEEKYDLKTLIELLQASDRYQIDPLKELAEYYIVRKCDVDVNNVLEVGKWSVTCNAKQLKDYCKRYIKENRNLVLQKRLEFFHNAKSEEEIDQEKEMIEYLFEEEED